LGRDALRRRLRHLKMNFWLESAHDVPPRIAANSINTNGTIDFISGLSCLGVFSIQSTAGSTSRKINY
jgi:hypothetical protein